MSTLHVQVQMYQWLAKEKASKSAGALLHISQRIVKVLWPVRLQDQSWTCAISWTCEAHMHTQTR
jgi:hypothetical protein